MIFFSSTLGTSMDTLNENLLIITPKSINGSLCTIQKSINYSEKAFVVVVIYNSKCFKLDILMKMFSMGFKKPSPNSPTLTPNGKSKKYLQIITVSLSSNVFLKSYHSPTCQYGIF